MTHSDEKKRAFSCLIHYLIQWYKEETGFNDAQFADRNDFTRSKVIKLAFFAAAIKVNGKDLLDVFNDWFVVTLGASEKDLVDWAVDDVVDGYSMDNSRLSFKEGHRNPSAHATRIKNAVKELQKRNPDLVLYDGLDLVLVICYWSSRRIRFESALAKGQFSGPLPIESIRKDTQYLHLAGGDYFRYRTRPKA